MWMLLGLLSLAGFPERFELKDQHGTILQLESQPKAEIRLVLAADARSVRALAKWVKTKSSDFFELNALANNLDDIRASNQIVDEILRNQSGHGQLNASSAVSGLNQPCCYWIVSPGSRSSIANPR